MFRSFIPLKVEEKYELIKKPRGGQKRKRSGRQVASDAASDRAQRKQTVTVVAALTPTDFSIMFLAYFDQLILVNYFSRRHIYFFQFEVVSPI